MLWPSDRGQRLSTCCNDGISSLGRALRPVQGARLRLSRSVLTLQAQEPGIDAGHFEQLARAAEEGCAVSEVLNAEINMSFELA